MQPRFRTRGAVAAAVLAATLTLAACGDTESSSEPAPEADTKGDASAFPLEIEHKFGTTRIPELPERVVTVGYGEDDFSLSLGVVPVGTRDFIGDFAGPDRPWAADLLADNPPEIIGAESLNFEKIAALDPDVIIGVYSFITERDYKTLSEIAPTVAQTDEYIDGGVPWQEELAVHGEALGRSELAAEVTEETEAAFTEAREEHPELEGKTFALASAEGGVIYVFSSQDLRSRIFTDLGMEVPAEIDELAGDGFFAEFSEEERDLLEVDALIILEDATTQEDYESDPIYTGLDAFEDGRVIFVEPDDTFAGAMGFSSPLSLPVAIDEIEDQLVAAVDGDPETEVPPVE